MDPTIMISPYRNEWALEFQQESDKIKAAIGDKALNIEHIGSTSMPGLKAKPVIDMVRPVENMISTSARRPSCCVSSPFMLIQR